MPVSAAEFISGLNAECASLKEFVSLLEEEQKILVEGDAERLLGLSESKARAAQALAQLTQTRKNNLLALGVKPGNGEIISWLRTNLPASLPVWQDILRLAEQLQYLNSTNGTLLQTRLRHNQQALTMLHSAANSAHGLYGADGQPQLSSSGRILGSV